MQSLNSNPQKKLFGAALMLPVRSALVSVCTVEACLLCDNKKVLGLIESGSLLYGFDVGVGSKKKLVRVLAQSLVNYVLKRTPAADELSEEKVLRSILPIYESMSAVKVAQIFCVTSDQVARILRDGHLTEIGRRDHSNQSPKISRESVFQFLKKRRIL